METTYVYVLQENFSDEFECWENVGVYAHELTAVDECQRLMRENGAECRVWWQDELMDSYRVVTMPLL